MTKLRTWVQVGEDDDEKLQAASRASLRSFLSGRACVPPASMEVFTGHLPGVEHGFPCGLLIVPGKVVARLRSFRPQPSVSPNSRARLLHLVGAIKWTCVE